MLVFRIEVSEWWFPLRKVLENLKYYLSEVLGVKVKTRRWKGQSELPFFLGDSYEFYETVLVGQSCLLMIAKEDVGTAPAALKKHWEKVQEKWTGPCICVQKAITPYHRKRLIEKQIPFVIPGNQMYLPDLGIALQEHFHKTKPSKKSFRPATQAVVIYALYHGTDERLIASELFKVLEYTSMTLSRAFDELQSAGIGNISRKGKERWWTFRGDAHTLWEQAKPFLRSPVKNRIWLKGKKPKTLAGLSALAHYSMLNPPTLPAYAISASDWKQWKESGIEEIPEPEDAAYELEVWHYNPNLFTEEETVDPFSLYLSLQETEDERIESALEEMIK